MVKDIRIDVAERDLLLVDKSDSLYPIYESIWGDIFEEDKKQDTLYCNVVVPKNFKEQYVRFISTYKPEVKHFKLRLICNIHGLYVKFSEKQTEGVFSAFKPTFNNRSERINASYLPAIDIDGEFLASLCSDSSNENLNRCYIYSAKQLDLEISPSDFQTSTLLSLTYPGNLYRYPVLGIGINDYLNSVISHTNLLENIKEQFSYDGRTVTGIEQDQNGTGININASPEQEVADVNLTPIEFLDTNFFERLTDEYISRSMAVKGVSDHDFIELLDSYDSIVGLYILTTDISHYPRIEGEVVNGEFDYDGEIFSSNNFHIVSETLQRNSIVMLDDQALDRTLEVPPMYVIGENGEQLYKVDPRDSFYVDSECYQCMIVKKQSSIQYMIAQDKFALGIGLRLISYTTENLRNMVAIVQDKTTGVLSGVVSDSTNISDITLDEITQHIYAKLNARPNE